MLLKLHVVRRCRHRVLGCWCCWLVRDWCCCLLHRLVAAPTGCGNRVLHLRCLRYRRLASLPCRPRIRNTSRTNSNRLCRCHRCLLLHRCLRRYHLRRRYGFWRVCSGDRIAWSACCRRGRRSVSHPCACVDDVEARRTGWTSCRKRASCRRMAALPCASEDAPSGGTSFRRLCRSRGCGSCGCCACADERQLVPGGPPPGSWGSRTWHGPYSGEMNEGMEPVFKQLIKSKKTKISNGLSIEINYLVFF